MTLADKMQTHIHELAAQFNVRVFQGEGYGGMSWPSDKLVAGPFIDTYKGMRHIYCGMGPVDTPIFWMPDPRYTAWNGPVEEKYVCLLHEFGHIHSNYPGDMHSVTKEVLLQEETKAWLWADENWRYGDKNLASYMANNCFNSYRETFSYLNFPELPVFGGDKDGKLVVRGGFETRKEGTRRSRIRG